MAVSDAVEKWSAQESDRASGEDGQSGTRTSRRVLTVTTTDPGNDTEADAEGAAGVPVLGEPHPRDFFKKLKRRRVRRVAHNYFEIDCDYEARGKEDQDNPLKEPPIIEYSSIREEEEITTDIYGYPIQTLAYEKPDPPERRPRSTRVMRITRNLPSYFDGIGSLYEDKVNSDTFRGYPPGTLYMNSLSATSVATDQFIYWRVIAEIYIRGARPGSTSARAWWLRRPHQGLYAKLINESDSSVWKFVPCIDGHGRRATRPMPLKEDGQQEFDKNAPAYFLEWEIFESISFNSMRLI